MTKLDFLIFGNGYGLKAPLFSQRFYWIIDQHTNRGAFYTWIGGFGAQLQSFQWRHPRAQERRLLSGHEYQPFQSHRHWGRVRVSWALTENVTYEKLPHIEDRLCRGGN